MREKYATLNRSGIRARAEHFHYEIEWQACSLIIEMDVGRVKLVPITIANSVAFCPHKPCYLLHSHDKRPANHPKRRRFFRHKLCQKISAAKQISGEAKAITRLR